VSEVNEVTASTSIRTKRLEMFLKIWYASVSQYDILHRCSNHPGQSQMQTVIKQLFHDNSNSEVEDSTVYKQHIHNDHTKIVSM
jgi:hypothetical protein